MNSDDDVASDSPGPARRTRLRDDTVVRGGERRFWMGINGRNVEQRGGGSLGCTPRRMLTRPPRPPHPWANG